LGRIIHHDLLIELVNANMGIGTPDPSVAKHT
jgi:hypothetical protein